MALDAPKRLSSPAPWGGTMPVILAVDQGTTSTKVLAVDEKREIVARASIPTPLRNPRPGWAENDPEGIQDATVKALSRVLDEVGEGSVEAIGITNQRETTLAWRKGSGEPLGPAVSWQCRRTEALCEQLARSSERVEMIRERTGLVVDPYFSGTKMQWLLEEDEKVQEARKDEDLAFGTVDAFLLEGLTGAFKTDPSNASRTMLYNLHEAAWDPELAALMDVPVEALPQVQASSSRFGVVDADTVLGSRLPRLGGVPVLGIAGDQQASLFGHGCLREGEAKGTLGTGAFFLVNTGETLHEPEEGVLSTVAWDLGDGPVFALEAVAFSCGSVLEWASRVGWLDAPDALDEAAGERSSKGAVFVPAFFGLAAPDWDPEARGALLGVSTSTTRGNIARAIAEGLAAQNVGLVEALAASGQRPGKIRLDGGVSGSEVLCSLFASGIGSTVHRSLESELTGLGAAGLAGLEAGMYAVEDVREGEGQGFEPSGDAAFVEAYRWGVDAVTR